MRRVIALAAIVVAVTFAACGGGSSSTAPTPAATATPELPTTYGGVVNRTKDTVGQLNQQQGNLDRQGDSPGYNP